MVSELVLSADTVRFASTVQPRQTAASVALAPRTVVGLRV